MKLCSTSNCSKSPRFFYTQQSSNRGHFIILFKKYGAPRCNCHKTMHSLFDAGSIPDSAFIFYATYFHIMLLPIVAFTFLISSGHEYYLAVSHMSHFLTLFEKLLTFLVGSELTTRDDLLSVDSNTLPLCHGRLRTYIVICIFMFKFPLII